MTGDKFAERYVFKGYEFADDILYVIQSMRDKLRSIGCEQFEIDMGEWVKYTLGRQVVRNSYCESDIVNKLFGITVRTNSYPPMDRVVTIYGKREHWMDRYFTLDPYKFMAEPWNAQVIERSIRNVIETKEKADMLIPREVIYNDPATIVYWQDGTKTVVKCGKGDIFDKEKGFAMAYMKKSLGNKGNFNNFVKKWIS